MFTEIQHLLVREHDLSSHRHTGDQLPRSRQRRSDSRQRRQFVLRITPGFSSTSRGSISPRVDRARRYSLFSTTYASSNGAGSPSRKREGFERIAPSALSLGGLCL
jgi:hypothetical protein